MNRIVHTLIQGNPIWHRHRKEYFNASEAAAMLGINKYMSREELLELKLTGKEKEVDEDTQKRFDLGHQYEALARPIASDIFLAEFAIETHVEPTTISLEFDSLKLSASLDGITSCGEYIWEHKTLNSQLYQSITKNKIPKRYKPQLEQGLLVSGAKTCLFHASLGNNETSFYTLYESDPKLREKIIDGWKLFAVDLELVKEWGE